MWPVLMFSSLKIPVLNKAVKFCQFLNTPGIKIYNIPVLRKGVKQLATSFHSSMTPKKVCIVGSGNWGSAIARLVGYNAARLPDRFNPTVNMWVFEEKVNGRNLTEIINTDHENVKYLPGRKLPENVVAVPDISDAALDADLLIFVLPHQFIKRSCAPLCGKLKPDAKGISLVKGFATPPGGGVKLISEVIQSELNLPISVLMGANLANEVADEKFCETTIGATEPGVGEDFKLLFQTSNFRLGLKEMIWYGERFYPGGKLSTYLESCGIADLITTCYGGRNRRVSEAFVRTRKPLVELEAEMLNGQKLQGPETAAEVNILLTREGLEDKFPLFTMVHRICTGEQTPEQLINCLRSHPANL
ncbi:glycerol-3-phosphate dehydrogenase [NAD(+)], cytoplasmic isoform X2 [Eurytemora carolleeae]|uniref:glycerol-3-phosphate dehydrogenase [NAD(+)], cytoplasmic isoform X2 n=1 Tax=Eurytemora carolleeae TaxID=1294199 RepID=UPI000C7667E6|nr:glycerol-3-phosphate dehydrogenase [NAD(+)], cytoplasmic isoform X2 [Eurytemora carolleeae]|eukprot:XP_023333753.1 glycerol-3-phosphate dehydrogenase [NAD(+)], cytoplasmic-like isoform X2 [Eurytemora affinis]